MMSEHTTWGIEQTREMLWIGPMRPDGHKVDDVVVGLTIGPELTASAALKQFHRAQLIAAAPDLLEVTRKVIEAADIAGLNGPLAQAARAAFARATGQQS